jgi:hypothetical protein
MSSIVEKYGPFVNDQIEHNVKQAARWEARGDIPRASKYLGRAEEFRNMLADLSSSAEFNGPSTVADNTVAVDMIARLTPDEIKDLPEELLSQLSITESDRKDFLIVEIMQSEGGVSSVDRLLIQIYRRTREIEKRTRLVSRLYRMTSKGFVFPHPQRKGIYGLSPFPGQDDPTVNEDELLIDPEDAADS